MKPQLEVLKSMFQFLVDEFGCSIASETDEGWGAEVLYMNRTTGIRVTYEIASAFVLVRLYRLLDGELVENSMPPGSPLDITSIFMEDALPEAERMRPAYEYGDRSEYHRSPNGLQRFVGEFATRCRAYCTPMLQGDFSAFGTAAQKLYDRLQRT